MERGRLYLAAMKGDWKSIEHMPVIQKRICRSGETTLHIAVVAKQELFVRKLLDWMQLDDQYNLTATNNTGSTALAFAAAVGNLKIAEMMVEKDATLPNIATTDAKPKKPLFVAALSGHSEMVRYLKDKTDMEENERVEIFIICVKNNLFVPALEMLEGNEDPEWNLARAIDEDGETALHVLARKPSAFVSASQPGLLRKLINIFWNQENWKQSKANKLFEKCLQAYQCDVESLERIPEILDALFLAAEVGNIEFLVKLIRFDFELLLKKNDNRKSIFHIAVEKRHESIFILLKELGSIGEIIAEAILEGRNNILHLAAGFAPQEKLNAISGVALQMQRELLWFKEVENIVSVDYREMENDQGYTPYALFMKEHEKLRRDGEQWMTNTAAQSMVVAVLIGSIMFSGQVADIGLDQNPRLSLAFTVSTAISLFGSSTCLIMFLSILTSRYSFDDFLVSLPVRLMIGVTSLYISIVAMMVSFATSFWLKNYKHRDAIFVVIVLCACVPIMDVLLKYRLVFDTFQSTFFRFRPRNRLLYEEVSYAPMRRSQSRAPVNPMNV